MPAYNGDSMKPLLQPGSESAAFGVGSGEQHVKTSYDSLGSTTETSPGRNLSEQALAQMMLSSNRPAGVKGDNNTEVVIDQLNDDVTPHTMAMLLQEANNEMAKSIVRDKGGSNYDSLLLLKHQNNSTNSSIIFPWNNKYHFWWYLTVLGAIITAFLAPYQIAFEEAPGTLNDTAGYVELSLNFIFTLDIIINFHLAYYDNDNGKLIFDRSKIATYYFSKMFWIDLVGVLPFETLSLYAAGILGQSSNAALLLSLLRLFRFVRLHRMKKLSELLQYDARISLLVSTLLRNFAVVFALAHSEACAMYFLARLMKFNQDTWLGPKVYQMKGYERYVTSLYWSIVTFCTVGYGDFACNNASEQIMGSLFMLINVVVAAWIIGSITLLIVKGDEKTGEYRDSLETLHQYGTMHKFDTSFLDKLKRQLRLEFHNREIADEQVLKNFPSAVRRKILRKLYLEHLQSTQLMKGVRPQFVDAFLSECKVEIFSPGEEIVERGSILSDLFLLVGGIAEVFVNHEKTPISAAVKSNTTNIETSFLDENVGNTYAAMTDEKELSVSDGKDESDSDEAIENEGGDKNTANKKAKQSLNSQHRKVISKSNSSGTIEAGEFIGEIGFFTESPQVVSVRCLTVCKTLTMSRSSYQLLAQDHPGSVGVILSNLLSKVQDLKMNLPKPLSILRAGSVFDPETGYYDDSSSTPLQEYGVYKHCSSSTSTNVIDNSIHSETNVSSTSVTGTISKNDVNDHTNNSSQMQRQVTSSTSSEELTAIQDLVKMHMSKQLDDQTTRLLFAASRGDTRTISLMCKENDFDPNNADYDHRTALMVASMKGNTDVVKLLLEYKADPNLTDMHGSSALLEAVKNCHEITMQMLLDHDATLCMKESQAASVLCQAVFDGDILLLKRLIRAGINVNAADYDKRTAAHIAAAEGNTAAIRVLAEEGKANLNLSDRWNNTVMNEAKRSNARQLLAYLQGTSSSQTNLTKTSNIIDDGPSSADHHQGFHFPWQHK